MEGRFWASRVCEDAGAPSVALHRVAVLDPWPGEAGKSFERKLAQAGFHVASLPVPLHRAERAVSEQEADIVVLCVEQLDIDTLVKTERMTAHARVPVLWTVPDATVEPWTRSRVALLSAKDPAGVVRARICSVLQGPPSSAVDLSPLAQAVLNAVPIGVAVVSLNHGIVSQARSFRPCSDTRRRS